MRRQRTVVEAYPNCPASEAFRQLARKADSWGMPTGARGNLEFFVERLVHSPLPRLASPGLNGALAGVAS